MYMIYENRMSKISGGFEDWRFRSILVYHVRDMLSFRLILDIYALF